jgi:cell division protein FtsL
MIKMRKNNKKLLKIEKMLIKMTVFLLVLFPVSIVLSKATLSNMNLEVEKLKREITVQKNANESLNMKVNELKSLANIDLVAESEGLSYNSNNIIVISNN